MESIGSIPCSQVPTICPCPKPDELSQCTPNLLLQYPLQYSLIYAQVFQVVSLPQVSASKSCMHLFSVTYMQHALSISLFLIQSPKSYFMRTTNHEANCYAIYPTVKHHQLKFLPQCKRPRFIPIYNNKQNYILKLYFNLVLLNSELNYKRFWTKCKQVFTKFNLVVISS